MSFPAETGRLITAIPLESSQRQLAIFPADDGASYLMVQDFSVVQATLSESARRCFCHYRLPEFSDGPDGCA